MVGIGTSQTPVQRSMTHLRTTYGITLAQYEMQYHEQDGACAVCGREVALEGVLTSNRIRRLVVDHDHSHHTPTDRKKACPSCLRGLLCTSCNSGIGMFKDDPLALRSAALYVERGGVWQGACDE